MGVKLRSRLLVPGGRDVVEGVAVVTIGRIRKADSVVGVVFQGLINRKEEIDIIKGDFLNIIVESHLSTTNLMADEGVYAVDVG